MNSIVAVGASLWCIITSICIGEPLLSWLHSAIITSSCRATSTILLAHVWCSLFTCQLSTCVPGSRTLHSLTTSHDTHGT